MRVYAVRVMPAMVSVRAAPGYRFDSAAQIHDFLSVVDFPEQRRLEIEQSHIENQLCAVQSDELAGVGS